MEKTEFAAMTLPKFSEIKIENIEKNVLQAIKECEEKLSHLEKNLEPTWSGIMDTLDAISVQIHNVWSPVSHLHSVKNTEELRKVYGKLIEPMTSFGLRLEQSEAVYKGLVSLRDGKEWEKLTPSQKRVLDKKLLYAKLSGIDLKGKEKESFNKIAKELSQLSTSFSNNVLDAIKSYGLEVTNPDDLGKLPAAHKELTSAAHRARFKEASKSTPEKGPWLFGIDFNSYGPFMENSPNRELRKELYLAAIQRATCDKYDNSENISKILQLKKKKAEALGFKTYAELSLATKMAESVEQIHAVASVLQAPSAVKAKEELEELKDLAKESGQEDFFHWDSPYWAKRLQEKKYSYEEDDLKPYFSFEAVTKGLFDLSENLFGIKVKPSTQPDVQVWEEKVFFYDIFSPENEHIASFYLDPFARAGTKRDGAWMDVCATRRKDSHGKVTRPVAYLVCNFTPPTEESPSLLTFRETETLFHEFGHGLQHMLTTIDELDVSGVNGVEWDTVELPSQFMENWCYHKKTLLNMAKHYKTGEALPEELFEKLVKSKNFMAGSHTLRQLQFALMDLHLHHEYDPFSTKTPFDVQREMAEKLLVMPPHEKDRFLCSFSHIFAGGYSAGYYSYKWAEILSADAFSLFEEKGLDSQEEVQKVGRKFRETILALGGSLDPMTIYKKFRGREPNAQALLRHEGMI